MTEETFFVPPAAELAIVTGFMKEAVRRNPSKVARIKPGTAEFERTMAELNGLHGHK